MVNIVLLSSLVLVLCGSVLTVAVGLQNPQMMKTHLGAEEPRAMEEIIPFELTQLDEFIQLGEDVMGLEVLSELDSAREEGIEKEPSSKKRSVMGNYTERIETRPDGTEVRIWVRRDLTPKTGQRSENVERSNKRGGEGQTVGALKRRQKSPALVLLDERKRETNLRKLRGKVVVLNMYATWCPPCRKEIPDFTNVHHSSDEDVEVYGIVFQSGSTKAAVSKSRALGAQYPILMGNDRVAKDWKLRGFPTTVIVDPNGEVSHRVTGLVNASQLRKMIAASRQTQ